MDVDEWKRLARARIESGKMSEDEWSEVLESLLKSSENDGLGSFDDAVDPPEKS